jgi:hypothetical protein
MISDRDILEAALIGYQTQKGQIEEKIAEVRARLGGKAAGESQLRGGGGGVPSPFVKTRRKMSAKARKSIAAAQKKRWAAWHKNRKG